MTYPNLSEITTVTLRNRTGVLVDGMMKSNALLKALAGWVPQEPGTVSMPDYIKLSAQGKAKMKNGTVYLLKDQD